MAGKKSVNLNRKGTPSAIKAKTIILSETATLGGNVSIAAGKTLSGGLHNTTAKNNDSAITESLTEANYPSGTIFSLDLDASDNACALTLPAVGDATGLEWLFLVTIGTESAVVLTIASTTTNLVGTAVCSDGIETDSGTTATWAAGKAAAGTSVKAWCDGTNWFLECMNPGATKAQWSVA